MSSAGLILSTLDKKGWDGLMTRVHLEIYKEIVLYTMRGKPYDIAEYISEGFHIPTPFDECHHRIACIRKALRSTTYLTVNEKEELLKTLQKVESTLNRRDIQEIASFTPEERSLQHALEKNKDQAAFDAWCAHIDVFVTNKDLDGLLSLYEHLAVWVCSQPSQGLDSRWSMLNRWQRSLSEIKSSKQTTHPLLVLVYADQAVKALLSDETKSYQPFASRRIEQLKKQLSKIDDLMHPDRVDKLTQEYRCLNKQYQELKIKNEQIEQQLRDLQGKIQTIYNNNIKALNT